MSGSGVVPVVSVVVPAWNAAGTLGEQLGALAGQVVPVAFEVLVCDNGSTDATRDVVRSWAGSGAGGAAGVVPGWVALRLVDASAVRGPGAARNVGAREARGEVLLFCDADDVVGQGWVAAMVAGLADHDLVTGQVELARLGAPRTGDAALPPSVFRLPGWPYLPASGAGYLGVRARVFAEVGGFDQDLRTGEDVDLCWRVQLAGHELVQHRDAVVHVRERPGLRTAFRQELHYGRGDRQLLHKYARLIDATRGLPPLPGPDGPASDDGGARPRPAWAHGLGAPAWWVRRAAAETYRLRHRDRVTTLVKAGGRWVGTRTGSVDASMPQLDVPPGLDPAATPTHDPAGTAQVAGPVPVVSVVVPAWNAAGTLGEQLGALAGQVVPVAFEVLVCDNGSTDATRDVVRSWAGSGAGGAAGVVPGWVALRLVDASAVRGPGAARNVGAREARGEVLLFCDADDVVGEGWVAAMVAGLAEHDLVAGQVELARLGSHYLDSGATPPPLFRMGFWPELPAASSNNLGVRADVFAEVGGFDQGLRTGEDVDLCWRVQLAGGSLGERRDAVVHVRQRGDLRGVLRQSFTYGRGDRQLLHKYARLAGSGEDAGTTGADGDAPGGPAPSPPQVVPVDAPVSSRKVLEVLRRRRIPEPTYVVRRLGRWSGARFGRVDRTRPPLDPAVADRRPCREGRSPTQDDRRVVPGPADAGPPEGPVPVVSVVVPAWNAAGTLGEQLAALAGQVVPVGFEVLVCDNGSTDATRDVVRSWAGSGGPARAGAVPRWVALRLVDASAVRGPGAARNVGAREARGEVLLFCDADDVVGEGWVAAMVAGLAEHDLLAGDHELGLLNPRTHAPGTRRSSVFHARRLPLPAAGAGNLGVRRSVFLDAGGFDPALLAVEDVDLCWRVQLAGHDLGYRPDAVVHVRYRTSLRQTFRQAAAYARAGRLLDQKYAVLAAERSTASPDAASDRPGRARLAPQRAWGRAKYLVRHPREALSPVAVALGKRHGRRQARSDGPVDPLVLRRPEPDDLPAG